MLAMYMHMNIMIFDVPVDAGGGLTILNEYYKKAKEDDNNNYYFILSVIELNNTKNIKVINFPWVKKSWIHRIIFDNLIAPFIVKKYRVDEILSLQNIIIPFTNVPQDVYLHQPLPFTKIKFKITKNFKFWVYQNLISRTIIRSLKKCRKVIVQTEWMAKACCEKANIEMNKIEIVKPTIKIDLGKYNPNLDKNEFIYPAGPLEYKNHETIVKACKYLKESGIDNYKIYFTLKGDENELVRSFYNEVKLNELPIDFIGLIDHSAVFEYYCHSKLIFASYIETFELPLLEARLHNCPIIAADCEFSNEILKNYSNIKFFEVFDYKKLAQLIKQFII